MKRVPKEIMNKFYLPELNALNMIRFEAIGNTFIHIENFKTMSCFTTEKVTVINAYHSLSISGKNLVVEYYSMGECGIKGTIDNILITKKSH